MKKAVFITNANAKAQAQIHPWKQTTPFNTREQPAKNGEGLMLFRCEFELPDDAKAARITATALGVFDLFVNGVRVGSMTENGMC